MKMFLLALSQKWLDVQSYLHCILLGCQCNHINCFLAATHPVISIFQVKIILTLLPLCNVVTWESLCSDCSVAAQCNASSNNLTSTTEEHDVCTKGIVSLSNKKFYIHMASFFSFFFIIKIVYLRLCLKNTFL